MLRRLGIRAKMLAVLAVPMIALLVSGIFISSQSVSESIRATQLSDVIAALNAYGPVSAALQQERAAAVKTYLDAPTRDAANQAARSNTDAALDALRPLQAKANLGQFPSSVSDAATVAEYSLSTRLTAVRKAVDEQTQTTIIQSNYNAIFGSITEFGSLLSETMSNRDVAQYVAVYRDLNVLADNLALEESLGQSLIDATVLRPANVRTFYGQTNLTEKSRTDAIRSLASLGRSSFKLPTTDPSFDLSRARVRLASGELVTVASVSSDAWSSLFSAQLVSIDKVRLDDLEAADQVAKRAASDSRNAALITIAITAAAMATALGLGLTVARGITNPLRRLTSAANDVREELPRLVEQVAVPGEKPDITLPHIPVESSDEVGRLADAFNAVNSQTVTVALEQAALRGSIAEMFVNVARRDQVLLNRQLSFIDSLERSEEDPATLANLFRLDHLATRMRRNAESLLVLAGIDSGRRLREPMPLSDVIRTASSEIEQYDRIDLDLPVDPHMLGFNALAAAHLMAELLENATVFSEPGSSITVRTGIVGDSVTVTIQDKGLGMSDEDLASANMKVGSTSATDSLGSQRLGLFVVGRLARRLGASVELMHAGGSETGTVTIVRFPTQLFSTSDATRPLAQRGAIPAARAIEPEAPLAVPVDLAALTDGETGQGLPKRRRSEDAERDDEAFILPTPTAATLSPELEASNQGDWTPDVTPFTASGLPTRTRGESAAGVVATPAPSLPSRPTTPEQRTGLFSGFRGRAAVPSADADAATQAPAESGATDGEFMQSLPVEPAALVIPGLVPDDEQWAPAFEQSAEPLAPAFGAQQAAFDPAPSAWAAPEPVAGDQGYPQSAFGAPVAESTGYPTPVGGAPMADSAAYDAAAYEAQAFEAPTFDAPTHEASAYQPQADEASAGDAQPFGEQQFAQPFGEQQFAQPFGEPQYAQPFGEPQDGAAPTADSEAAGTQWAPEAWQPEAPQQQPEPVLPSWAPAEDVAPAGTWAPIEEPSPQHVLDEARAWNAWLVEHPEHPAHPDYVAQPDPATAGYGAATGDWSAPAAPGAELPDAFGSVQAAPGASAWAPEGQFIPAEQDGSADLYASPAAFMGGQYAGEQELTAAAPAEVPLESAQHAGEQYIGEGFAGQPAAEQEQFYAPAAVEDVPTYAAPAAFMTVPQLESLDDEPADTYYGGQPAEPAPAAAPEPQPYAEMSAPVEPPVVAQQYPVAPEPAAGAWLTPAAPQGAPQPSFSEVLAQPSAEKSGVFGRLFGRGKRKSAAPAESTVPAPPVAQPVAPTAWSAPVPAQAPAPAFPSPASQPQTFAPPVASMPAYAPAPAVADFAPEPAPAFEPAQDPSSWAPAQPVAAPSTPYGDLGGTETAPAPVAWVADEVSAWTPSASAVRNVELPSRRPEPTPAPAAAPVSTSWESTPAAPAATQWSPTPEPGAAHGGSLIPGAAIGALDSDTAAMLAMRSDIQQQALSELSQLSAYRPTVAAAGPSLVKRTPGSMPAQPIEETPTTSAQPRDAEKLRARLASFQSGSSRGRQVDESHASDQAIRVQEHGTLVDDVIDESNDTSQAPSW